jgi:hypothetical protein
VVEEVGVPRENHRPWASERDAMYIYTPIYMYLLVISNDGINRCHYISLLCVAAHFLYSLIKYIHIWYPVFTRFRIHSLRYMYMGVYIYIASRSAISVSHRK